MGKCVPQQLGDTLSHTNQCPDSGRQKKAMAENSLAMRTIPIVDVLFLERMCELLQASPREAVDAPAANPSDGEGSCGFRC